MLLLAEHRILIVNKESRLPVTSANGRTHINNRKCSLTVNPLHWMAPECAAPGWKRHCKHRYCEWQGCVGCVKQSPWKKPIALLFIVVSSCQSAYGNNHSQSYLILHITENDNEFSGEVNESIIRSLVTKEKKQKLSLLVAELIRIILFSILGMCIYWKNK